MATKANPGAFDCFAAAKPLEPMFVLLGRDRMAPALVRIWAAARASGGQEDPVKINEAEACAVAMDTWLQAMDRVPMEPQLLLKEAALEGVSISYPVVKDARIALPPNRPDIQELLACAAVNFNTCSQSPLVQQFPIFQLALRQLKEAAQALGCNPDQLNVSGVSR